MEPTASLGVPASFWAELSRQLSQDRSVGQLRVGRQGVYLIDRSEEVVSFGLAPWNQLLGEPDSE